MWDNLLSVDEQLHAQAWSDLFLNEPLVQKLLSEADPQQLTAIITAGPAWQGGGWDTTKAAVTVRKLTQVALVESEFKNYLMPFLYSLALAGNLEVPLAELHEVGAEVAFRLAERWTGQSGAEKESPKDRAKKEEEEEDQEDEVAPRLAWEKPEQSLASDLQLVLTKFKLKEKFEVKTLLEEVPPFRGLQRGQQPRPRWKEQDGQDIERAATKVHQHCQSGGGITHNIARSRRHTSMQPDVILVFAAK